ncbi:hypothetical protein QNI19_03875 [Cytophagaceae bacterium DM2B3-1]|uniref:Uncharacterized protein n=1 Tax=Xanthocytophaga flava TaxID=3048013 RepID=A0ABT7CEC9_9BACT|nr:hypothetical protein [Xanthocytophaga flavus]MDJ1468881.1 hypothetical protein [Xanthocytophaga flavus]MDJ1492055.1 hypothetical protein [Xanthocytophaga flavus]
MFRIVNLFRASFLAVALTFIIVFQSKAQQTAPEKKDDKPATEQKQESSFGNVMLKLGKGLMKEVSRRLNLEETEIITVKKETSDDGREKYRVNTGKFSFTVRKKNKQDTTGHK